jgi:cobalt-zinc-cadmium efflux system outer membrane protein
MKNDLARKIILLCILLFFQNNVFAATTYLSGIDEAIQMAIENSGELRSSQARFGVSEAKVFSADTMLNPVLITDNGIAEENYRAGIQVIIETASKRKKRTEVAKMNHQIMQDEVSAKILDIKSQVRKAYVELYSAQEKEKAAEEILTTINNLLDVAQKKRKTCNISDLDIAQIEIAKINTENDLCSANLEIAQAYNELNLLLGHSLDGKCKLGTPSLEHNFKDIAALTEEQHNLNIQKLEETAYENRPELKMEQDKIGLAQKQLALAKANRIPNLLVAAGPDIAAMNGSIKTSAFIIGAVDIPIFDRQQGPIKEAIAAEKQSEMQYEFEKDKILSDVKSAYNRIVVGTKLVESYKNELIPKSDEIVQKSHKQFEEGKIGIIVPLLAQESAINVRFGYIKIMADYQTAISDLEKAIGVPL